MTEYRTGFWTEGPAPANVTFGANTIVTDRLAFKRFRSALPLGLKIGAHCTMDGVHFDVGEHGSIEVGDYCYFTSVVLLSELKVQIGSYVLIGWNTTISDSDFHLISPAERVADAIALSPLGKGMPRPVILKRPVIIEDNALIGPGCTISKACVLAREQSSNREAWLRAISLPLGKSWEAQRKSSAR